MSSSSHPQALKNTNNTTKSINVFIYDRRKGDKPETSLDITSISKYLDFEKAIREYFTIDEKEPFVLVNTNRICINNDEAFKEVLTSGQTLYILTSVDQELSAPTHEKVEFIPHYDTIVKSGIYEYYASEGQNPLPFAIAELVDNALAATADNLKVRQIEVQLLFDDSVGKPVVCIWDNGQGMTSKVLNNWAIYRLSKFNRDDGIRSYKNGNNHYPKEPISGGRYLNSDISWFGVGGKQAIFFIGDATRMITKTEECRDVHELCISKEAFELKERRRESIYSGEIYNRRPGDCVHIAEEDENIRGLIRSEEEHPNFTSVVISGINSEHVQYLKSEFDNLCKELAHIYHYYIHGPRGNENRDPGLLRCRNFNIEVVLYEKGKEPKRRRLRDINDDIQSQYIRTSASMFEFRAHCEGGGIVEGMLRYHPFLYDQETYPQIHFKTDEVDESEAIAESKEARGNKPVFDCYWNGRLIPYTAIDCLDWCSPAKRRANVPIECYQRFSGVLWTNDAFQVSTNKLTFIDLEVKLREKSTLFNRVILGQEQRGVIARSFHDWIRECHDSHDKQVKFKNFEKLIKRSEFNQKNRQFPWAVFDTIEWDGRIFKKGDLVRTQRCVPVICGRIEKFLLYGDYEADVFATGGEMEIIQEPHTLYGEKKTFSLAKLDRQTSQAGCQKFIKDEEAKLPSSLTLEWINGDEVTPNAKLPVGSIIGEVIVNIVNGKKESMSKLPGERARKLLVEMKLIRHGPDKEGDKVISQHVCQHGGKSWPFWFRKISNLTKLGPHSLVLQVIGSDTLTNLPASCLPKHKIKFTVIEGPPKKFTVGILDQPLKIGSPFNIPLNLLDNYGNPSKATGKFHPELTASGLEMKFESTSAKGNSLIIKDVVALGVVQQNTGKDFTLKVRMPDFEEETQTLKIRLLPGLADHIDTEPGDDPIQLENGTSLQISVLVKDISDNITAQPKLNVVCKLSGSSNLPTYTADCSSTGQALLSGSNILISNLTNKKELKAKIDLPNIKDVKSIERIVHVNPSTKASLLEIFYLEPGNSIKKQIQNEDVITCLAGQTLSGFSFNVFDEGNRKLNVDSALAAKIKVNWINKVNREVYKQQLLPDIKAPTSINDTKFCQITISGSGTEFSFSISPQPDLPNVLKCSCSNAVVQVGGLLKSEIQAVLNDKHGNPITKLPSNTEISVTGEGLVEESVKMVVQKDGTITIKNIQFDDGLIGIKELMITCQGLACYQRIEVTSGPPAKVRILNLKTTQPIGLYSNCRFPKPITVQLCDAEDNPCSESNIKVVLNKDSGLKLSPVPSTQKTNEEGIAIFEGFTVSGQRGTYEIRIKALIARSSIDANPIRVRIDADPTKPMKLRVESEKMQTSYVVGSTLKDFWVHVIAENEEVMKCSAKDFYLKLWPVEKNNIQEPPNKAVSFQPSKKTNSDKENHFYFRDVVLPEQTGNHCIMIMYSPGNTNKLKSEPIKIKMIAGSPVQLVPTTNIPTPTVSNTHRATSRYLVRNLTLQLKDKYGNLTGNNCDGQIVVSINKCPQADETPLLQGNIDKTEFPMWNGSAVISTLSIEENTPGKDGQQYMLSFTPRVTNNAGLTVQPFKLPFLFYNDVRKQQQMGELAKERDHLNETIKAYRSLFDTTRQLLNEMQVSVHEASVSVEKLKNELRRQNVPAQALSSVENVDAFIAQLTTKRAQLQSTPRRQCSLNSWSRGEQGILGKVAHLAQVLDDDVARVLSWHMAGDMDCVITMTTDKAKKVYKESNGQQQVLPLDSIYRRNLPEWNKPLPHQKGRSNNQLSGHPVYARSLMMFPSHQEDCKTVFGMLLGDTLILDDLDAANSYRQEVVKYAHCPTILTRSGDRIRSNGKFGGSQNKAPPIERLRGIVFSSPLPLAYHTTCTQIEQFKAYKQAMIKHSELKLEHEGQTQLGQTKEMQVKHRECREAEIQLREIEKRLGMTPSRYDMPASPSTMLQLATTGTSKPRSSRQRTTTAESTNPPTPTRSRRSTTTLETNSPSKRPRRV